MDTVQQLVDAVTNEGGFDASPGMVLGWLSRRQRTMCARSGCFRRRLSVGPTVAGVAAYSLPGEVAEVRELTVDGVIYDPGVHRDLADGGQGWLWLGGTGGLSTREDSESGVAQVALFPTPTEAGLAIVAYAICIPGDLEIGVDAGVRIPAEFTDALVNGAVATGLKRLESRGDLAAELEQEFAAACVELRRRTNRLLRGSGPTQVRVAGINA